MKRPWPARILFAALFLVIGATILMTIAHVANPPQRCEERGGVWVVEGRFCEEAPDSESEPR
jgi:hypothetical protein